MAMLRAEQVSFSYQGKHETVHAVKDFNYDFEPGSFYAIVGKSGSGKTTLLSLLAGLELPTQGQVAFQGWRFRGIPPPKWTVTSSAGTMRR